MHPNVHSIKRGSNFFKVIELHTHLKKDCLVFNRDCLTEHIGEWSILCENDSKVFVSLSVLKLFVRIEVITATQALAGLV